LIVRISGVGWTTQFIIAHQIIHDSNGRPPKEVAHFTPTMKTLDQVIIPLDKLTRYLLVPREQNDKAKFLAQAGFTLKHVEALMTAIEQLFLVGKLKEDSSNEYGTFYRIEGELTDPEGHGLTVVSICLKQPLTDKYRLLSP
jgi:hypothetical protein